jgi:hypothetical protein
MDDDAAAAAAPDDDYGHCYQEKCRQMKGTFK